MSEKKETTHILVPNTLVVFVRPRSTVWQCRYQVDGKWQRQSTNERNLDDANVLLLSPIVGEFANEETLMNFIPPRSTLLSEVAELGKFPMLTNCEIHVGSEDWQSNPNNVKTFADLVGLKVHVVQDGGHMLPKEYVSDLLDNWLY